MPKQQTSPVTTLRWHYDVHAYFKGLLRYYLLTIRGHYDKDRVFQSFADFCKSHNITSYRVGEIYGSYDLVFRMWIPGTQFTALNSDFRVWATNNGALFTSPMDVARLWAHQAWAEGKRPNLASISDIVLRAANGDIDDQATTTLLDEHAARLVPATKPSIRFLVSITKPDGQMTDLAFNELSDQVSRIILNDKTIREAEIYLGEGSEWIIIEGSVAFADYPSIARINAALQGSGIRNWNCRTTTYLYCDNIGSLVDVDRPNTGGEELVIITDEERLRRLLTLSEGAELEVKSSLRLDMVKYILNNGTKERLAELTDKVLKAIASFMNTTGGSIIIGALEPERVPKEIANSLPRVGMYLLCGADPDLLEKGIDVFNRTAIQLVREHLGSRATQLIGIHYFSVEGKTLFVIDVSQSRKKIFFRGELWMREGGLTRKLNAEEIEIMPRRD